MDAYIQTETPTRNYDLEIAAQVPFAEKAKERYELAQAKLNKLREQATKHEAELQQLINKSKVNLQVIETKVANLRAGNA